jgi:hypothetical protein
MTNALDEDSRSIEDYAEILKIPAERMRHIMTCTLEELDKEVQALDPNSPDDQRFFLAIMARGMRDVWSRQPNKTHSVHTL